MWQDESERTMPSFLGEAKNLSDLYIAEILPPDGRQSDGVTSMI